MVDAPVSNMIDLSNNGIKGKMISTMRGENEVLP